MMLNILWLKKTKVCAALALWSAFSLAQAADKVEPIAMVNLPAGTLNMGCVAGRDDIENGCEQDESPSHLVNIRAFQIGKYEVTLGQWRAVMGRVPSGSKNCDDSCPVGNVSWDDAQLFIQKLNASTTGGFRLPTEAEWEYACRADSKTTYCGGNKLDELAWYDQNSKVNQNPVGKKKPNAFGLYDMTGNVWEWVQDCRHTNYIGAPTDGSAWETACEGDRRRIRGGAWNSEAKYARAALRVSFAPSTRFFYTGLRLAKTVKP
jgi:formylglycine-generating enzyme required for sulfatase activity